MSFGEAFKLALRSIIGNKMRSFLTMLGMIIGVGSVIALIGVSQGLKSYMVKTFSDMGTNGITVYITPTDTRRVDIKDVYNLVNKNKDVFAAVSPMVEANSTVKFDTKSMTTNVSGVSEDYLKLKKFELSTGRFLLYSDVVSRNNVCVIGTYIEKKIFHGKAEMGDTIKINGQIFTVVGIQKEKGKSERGSADECIYIPYTCATRLAGNAVISSFSFDTVDSSVVSKAEKLLNDFLFKIMKNKDLFYVLTMASMLTQLNQMMAVFSMVLSGIAGISLLVAGIGIMNIMLVSVTERTKEIGIRKSLGAKKKDIMRQFVIEAALVSTIGGVIGILIGAVSTTQLGAKFGLNAAPTAGSILLAFGVSAAVGIGFGYLPANKAAKLNPIDALRSE